MKVNSIRIDKNKSRNDAEASVDRFVAYITSMQFFRRERISFRFSGQSDRRTILKESIDATNGHQPYAKVVLK